MSDTVKIERPIFCRRHEDLGGRLKEVSLGTTVKVRTRAHESEDDLSLAAFELKEDSERDSEG